MTAGSLRWRGVPVAALGVALMLGLGGCVAPPSSGPHSTPTQQPATDATVAVYQPRSDIALGRVAVQVRNASAEMLTVVAVRVESSSFHEPLVWMSDRQTALPAGRAVDLRADLTAPNCDSTTDRSLVHLSYRLGEDVEVHEATLSPSSEFDTLQTLHDEACRRLRVEDVAVITAASVTFDDRPDARGILRLSIAPTGGEGIVRIDSISSTPLIEPVGPDGKGTDDLTVDAAIGAEGPLELLIPIATSRCDAHALAEDKVGTLIAAFVTTPDGATGRIILPAAPEFRAQVYAFFVASCGLG